MRYIFLICQLHLNQEEAVGVDYPRSGNGNEGNGVLYNDIRPNL
jgi:hypothetical protein